MHPEPEGQDFSSEVGQPSFNRLTAGESHSIQRAALLCMMQKVIMGLLLFGLVMTNAFGALHSARSWTYLLVGLLLLTALSWRLGAAGYYRLAATGIVLVALCVPWFFLFVDRSVLRGDYSPMSYATIALMLAAMLIGVRAVLAVAAIEGLGFAVLISLDPGSGFNWLNLLCMIFVVTTISLTYAATSQSDLHELRVANDSLHELREILKQESRQDPLTGLHNRRSLAEQAVGEIRRAQRNGTGLGLVMLDIDHFKEVNDVHGHSIGDEVLGAVASLLSARSRAGDIACRLGGDEFLLVLVESNLTGAALRAEQLRQDVEKANVGGMGQPVTVSVGVAAYPDQGDRFEVLLEAADQALYTAKAAGRNRVAVAPVAP